MKTKVHAGMGERTRPNWRRGDTFIASGKYWLRKVGLWENRALTDEETWWGKVITAAAAVASNDPDKFTSESLKRKFTDTGGMARTGFSAPAAPAKAAVARK